MHEGLKAKLEGGTATLPPAEPLQSGEKLPSICVCLCACSCASVCMCGLCSCVSNAHVSVHVLQCAHVCISVYAYTCVHACFHQCVPVCVHVSTFGNRGMSILQEDQGWMQFSG